MRKDAKLIRNRFLTNTFWILFGKVLHMLISFFISIATARYLGPSNNGVLNYATSYISFFTAIIGLGLNGVIIYEFVNHREEEGKILGTAIFLRFILGIISVFLLMGIITITDGNDKIIVGVTFLQAIQLPFLCWDTINYWFQSNMQSKYSVLVSTVAYLVMSLYKVYLLISGKSVGWFAFSISLDIIICSILYYAIYQKKKTQKLGFSVDVAKRLLKSSLPFILANLMVVVYGQMDKIMIKHLLGSTREVGLYSCAITICTLASFIPVAILDSARPLIAEAKKENEEKYNLRFRQLVAAIMWFSFIYSFFVALLSKYILYYMYGNDYMDANMCLKIAVWYTAFSYLGSARSFWLICEDKKKYVFYFSAIGAMCNLIMNFIFIPLWGINGAAVATLATQIIANFLLPCVFKTTRPYGKAVLHAILLRKLKLKELFLNLKKGGKKNARNDI